MFALNSARLLQFRIGFYWRNSNFPASIIRNYSFDDSKTEKKIIK